MDFTIHLKKNALLLTAFFLLFSKMAISSSHLPIQRMEREDESLSGKIQEEETELEKGFFHGVGIVETDTETGIDQATFNTKNDDHRYTIGLFLNANPMKATEIMGGEILYGFKFATGGHFELFASMTKANLDAISDQDNASTMVGSLISGGFGFGLRSTLIQHFIDSKTLFETVSGHLTFSQLSSSSLNGPFVGPGLKAVYGIHQRVGKTIHYGLKVAYDLASLRRPALNSTESTGDRALILTSLTLGLELTLYY